MLRKRKKGQSAIEYSVILIIIMGALLATGNYFKRGIQGRWKDSADQLGDQYDPRVANSSVRHTIQTNTYTTVLAVETALGTQSTRNDITTSVETKRGSMAVGAY